MEKIILVRPSDHKKSSGLLTGEGYGKVFYLAKRLERHIGKINKLNITIISSPEVCAYETSKIIASELDVSIKEDSKEHVILGKVFYKKTTEDNESIARLVEKAEEKRINILIIVTHQLQISSFPKYYSNTRLWRPCSFTSLEHGEALILNCEKAEAMVLNQPFNIFV